ncbi:hypothetical protein [Burkholderia sp. Bp8963]|uniref:hypothetical protein n=1 Tax=Burkholderia sp. Bp8963 TaxID=2184547 RepID=UPI000F5B2C27
MADTATTPPSPRTRVRRIAALGRYGKVRAAGPEDADSDMSRPVWAGVLPMALQPGTPVADAAPGGTPEYVQHWEALARQPR